MVLVIHEFEIYGFDSTRIQAHIREPLGAFWQTRPVYQKLEVPARRFWQAFWGAERSSTTSLHLTSPDTTRNASGHIHKSDHRFHFNICRESACVGIQWILRTYWSVPLLFTRGWVTLSLVPLHPCTVSFLMAVAGGSLHFKYCEPGK